MRPGGKALAIWVLMALSAQELSRRVKNRPFKAIGSARRFSHGAANDHFGREPPPDVCEVRAGRQSVTHHWLVYASMILAIWVALVGGVFKAFSEFIMSALDRAARECGIEAMQQINRRVLRTEFVAAIVALSVVSPLFAAYCLWAVGGTASVLTALAASIYWPSVFLVTVFGNIPMNKRLDGLVPGCAEAGKYWAIYARRWTLLNHWRTVGCLATSIAYALAALSFP